MSKESIERLGEERFFDREISWLKFNERVLSEAFDSRNPLLERVKFLQIFTTNLDEFFMKRVERARSDYRCRTKGLLQEIRHVLEPMLERQKHCWNQVLLPELAKNGIHILEWNDLDTRERLQLETYFQENLFPVLTPLAVDSGHPFPFISNLSSSLGVILRQPVHEKKKGNSSPSKELFARIKIPSNFPAWIDLKAGQKSQKEYRFIGLTDVIVQFLDRLFPNMDVLGTVQFRVTRNADLDRYEEEAQDLLEMMTQELKERRFASAVRLEHTECQHPNILKFLKRELQLSEGDVYLSSKVDFAKLQPIWNLPIYELKFENRSIPTPAAMTHREGNIFDIIRKKDVLVHHPYESFNGWVGKFISSAASDPKVLAIKMVLYRIGSDNPFISDLIRAAEAGKQVVCFVELKARFDEAQNIQVARVLEKAGVHVVYGMVGVKTHCKASIVVRQEEDCVRTYAHIGTGNYNPGTAQLYTDFGFFTSRPDLTLDLTRLFHFLTGHSLIKKYDKLIVAPMNMKNYFLELIQFEIDQARQGKPARIIAKTNSLEDRDLIDALYEASQAGVQIDLIVRGFCCLRAQVPGLSENIRVVSIIGRFLEHSRLYYFQHGSENPDGGLFLIGSADWMQRNLQWRVEAVAPIEDFAMKKRLWNYFNLWLGDYRQTWELAADGSYVQRQPRCPDEEMGVQERLIQFYTHPKPGFAAGITHDAKEEREQNLADLPLVMPTV